MLDGGGLGKQLHDPGDMQYGLRELHVHLARHHWWDMQLTFMSAALRLAHSILVAATVIVAAVQWPASRALAMDEDIPPATFLKDYRAALARQPVNQGRFHLEGEVHQVFDRFEGKPPFRDQTVLVDCGSNGHDRGFRVSYPGKDAIERTIITPRGRRPFAVLRTAGKGLYRLEHIDTIPENLTTFELYSINAARSVGDRLLTPLVESSRFTVNRATKTSVGGRDALRVDFDYRPADPKSQYDMKGELILDPSNDYAVVSYSVKSAVPDLVLEISGSVRYSERDGCRLLPEELTTRQYSRPTPTRQFETRHDFRAKRISNEPPADSTFEAAYYGLADLDRPRSRPGNYSAFWAFGIGGLALALTFILRRMAR